MTAVDTTALPLTVSQLTQAIKMSLESNFPSILLQGEISNSKLHTSGHLYFSLKDAGAQIAAVMYRGDASRLKVVPKDGDQVIIRGDLNVYPPSGKYQIIVKELRPVGVGELLLKLEELKIKLNKKGYFKKEHKRPLPKMPRRIGVITSPTGAAIQDILNILTRRFSGFHLILNPVKVQGEGAAQEIAQAIKQFNDYDLVDVMIVGRGGGSIEDLWAFNEEIVADALYNSRIPTISAVGHETDHCIADYVADVRAPTPSAAAEIVIAEKAHQLQQLTQVQQRMQQTLRHLLRNQRQQIESMKRHPLFATPYGVLGAWMQKLDDIRTGSDLAMKQRLFHTRLQLEGRQRQLQALKPTAMIAHLRQRLSAFDRGIKQVWTGKILPWNREKLKNIENTLKAIDPKNLLTKGYCILFAEKERSVITSVSAVEKGDDLRLLLADGEIVSTVKEIEKK